jgi:hypothetical protein
VGALANAGAKGSGRRGVHVDEQVAGGCSASARDPPVEVETALTHDIIVCDVSLVSCCTGAIDRDAVYSLLTECL